MIGFYRERARGGAGLIIVVAVAHRHAYLNMVSLRGDEFIPGHHRLVKVIKEVERQRSAAIPAGLLCQL